MRFPDVPFNDVAEDMAAQDLSTIQGGGIGVEIVQEAARMQHEKGLEQPEFVIQERLTELMEWLTATIEKMLHVLGLHQEAAAAEEKRRRGPVGRRELPVDGYQIGNTARPARPARRTVVGPPSDRGRGGRGER